MASNNPSQPARHWSFPPSFPSQDGLAPRHDSGANNVIFGPSAAAGPSQTFLRWNRQTLQFSVNAWVFVVASLAIFPFLPISLSHRAYKLSFAGTIFSSLFSLLSLYRNPQAWNFHAVRSWFDSIIVTKDFICIIYCLTFISSHVCLKFSLIPILCRAVTIGAMFLRRNFSSSSLYREYLEEACMWVEWNAITLSFVSSHAEIALGFLLILSLFSWHRSFTQTFLYWQLLKLMYKAPVTARYHRPVWANIGRALHPLVRLHAPFLWALISALERWWVRRQTWMMWKSQTSGGS